MPAVHVHYLNQFQKYHTVMRERTDNGLASENSYFQSVPFLSDLDEQGKSDVMRGCCLGFALCRGYMKAIGLNAWWNEMLAHVADWNGDHDTLKSMVALPSAQEKKQMLLGNVFEMVMGLVIGVQDGLKGVLPNAGDSVMGGKEQEYIASNGQAKRMSPVVHMHGEFTEAMLNKLLAMPDLQSMLSSNQVITVLASLEHATHLGYDGVTWDFDDINIPVGTYASSDLHVVTAGIFKELDNFLHFQMMPVQPAVVDILNQTISNFSNTWLEESDISASAMDFQPMSYCMEGLSLSVEDLTESALVDSHQYTLDALEAMEKETVSDKTHQNRANALALLLEDSVDQFVSFKHNDISDVMRSFVEQLNAEECFRLINDSVLSRKRKVKWMSADTAKWVPVALAAAVTWFNDVLREKTDSATLAIKARFEVLWDDVLIFGNKAIIEAMCQIKAPIIYDAFVESTEAHPDEAKRAWKSCPEKLLHCMLQIPLDVIGCDEQGSLSQAFKADREKRGQWIVDGKETFVNFSFPEFLILQDQDTLIDVINFIEKAVAKSRDRIHFVNEVLGFARLLEADVGDALLQKVEAVIVKENQALHRVSKASVTLYGVNKAKGDDRRRVLGPADAPTFTKN